MRYVLPAIVLAMAFSLACGDPTTTQYCAYNSDCPDTGAIYCIAGVCLENECVEDRDCDAPQICVEGTCSDG